MIELDGQTQDMTGLEDFHEATWVFKRKETYYLTYADNFPGKNRMHYATSSQPLGPWTHRGIYLEPTGCDTTHGSVVEYKGQWYQFYHNQTLSGHGNLRTMCVDRLNFNDDGTIQTVTQTKEGVPAAGPVRCRRIPNTVKYGVDSAVTANGARWTAILPRPVEKPCATYIWKVRLCSSTRSGAAAAAGPPLPSTMRLLTMPN